MAQQAEILVTCYVCNALHAFRYSFLGSFFMFNFPFLALFSPTHIVGTCSFLNSEHQTALATLITEAVLVNLYSIFLLSKR